MMRVRRCGWLVVGASGVTLLAAVSGGWQNKDFKDWSDKDARSLMMDSPWAKQMRMPASGRPDVMVIEPGANGGAPPSASLGNPASTTTGPNMTNSGYPGSTGPADANGTHTLPNATSPSGVAEPVGAPEPAGSIRIIWASAAPIRLAMVKLRSAGNPVTDEEIANATKPRQNYVIAVAGLAAPDRDFDSKELAAHTSLKVKAKAPVMATDARYRRIGSSDVYFFRFPRTSLPIAASDQEVEFKMRMGKIEIKRKFDLKEMQYQGQLAL